MKSLTRKTLVMGLKIKEWCILFLNYVFCLFRVSLFKPKTVVVGDSHVIFTFSDTTKSKRFSVTSENILIVYMGPLLLYTVAQKGFRFDNRVKNILKKVGDKIPVIFMVGEIDCRVNFVKRNLNLSSDGFDKIAMDYQGSVSTVINDFGFSRAIIFSPMPPSDFGSNNLKFPRNGSLFERVSVTKMITESLVRLSSPEFVVFNLMSVLSISNGSINPKYTNDGVHLNSLGRKQFSSKFCFENIE